MAQFDYDISIIGGGVAGLSAAILLSREGYKTALFEKHKFPFHKVCGEYISLESLEFLNLIGIDTAVYNLPLINKLRITTPESELVTRLPLGGIGVSRYLLDNKLAGIARENGVEVFEQSPVFEVDSNKNLFRLKTKVGIINSRIAIGAFGKKSNLSRSTAKLDKRNNFIGVKYHVIADLPEDIIELHIFKNGYCGISKVEGSNKYCLCYMTTAENLSKCNNEISLLEKNILSLNKNLKNYLNSFQRVIETPVTISQLEFGVKNIVKDNMIMLGDSAGTIAPLCGNGMSMAFHSAYIAAGLADKYLAGDISYETLLKKYSDSWRDLFARRIKYGNYLQSFFLNDKIASASIRILDKLKFLHAPLIKLTHGNNFINHNQVASPINK